MIVTAGELCGWRVESEIALPELLPWQGPWREPDLFVRHGSTPSLADARIVTPRFQVGADGACRVAAPGVATYFVDALARSVTVDPANHALPGDVRAVLLGTVLAVLCVKRGRVPLHASCVRIGGAAVAFAGHRGAGKSTLAAMLSQRGHALLADDVTVVDIRRPRDARVLCVHAPRLKLCQDAVVRLGIPFAGLEPIDSNKWYVPSESPISFGATPLTALVHLDPSITDSRLRRLKGVEAAARVNDLVYRAALLTRLGFGDQLRMCFLDLLAATGPTWVVGRLATMETLEAALGA